MKRAEIEHLLPGILQRTISRGNLLFALLEVMEGLHAPSETILEDLDAYFDPYRAPDEFVPYIAGWVDLGSLLIGVSNEVGAPTPTFPTGLEQLRELVATAAFLSKWRGTAKGLLRFLETATGVTGFEIDERVRNTITNKVRPFHLRIHAPKATESHRALIEQVIELEKPAYVTYELNFR